MAFPPDVASIRFSQSELEGIDYRLEAWEGFEQYHRIPEQVVVIRTESGDLDLAEFQLKAAKLVIDCHDADELISGGREINTLIRQVSVSADESNQFLYVFHLVHKLWLLTRNRFSRIFQEKSSKEIIVEVLGEAGVDLEMKLSKEPRKREYCVQYEETDFAFISRLAEDDGYTFFVDLWDDKVIFVDNPRNLEDASPMKKFKWNPGLGLVQEEPETVGGLESTKRKTWATAKVKDYNYRTPDVDLTREATRDGQGGGYMYLTGHTTTEEGEVISRLRLDERTAEGEVLEAMSTIRSVTAGVKFELKDFPADSYNREYQVVRVTHHYQNGHYRNEFACIPADVVYRPPRVTPRPVISGLQTAIVVGPDGYKAQEQSAKDLYVDELGRIKVLFHWDLDTSRKERSSCWIRLMREYAGPGYGVWHLPRVGNEVLVAFLNGNPDRPVVVGSVHHAGNVPPVKLPEDKTQNTSLMPSTNELRFEDKEGQELVYMHAQKDHTRVVENDESITVGKDRSKIVSGNQTATIKGTFTETITKDTKITIVEGKYSHDVAKGTASYHVKGDVSETYEGKQTTTVTKEIDITSETAHIHLMAATKITLEVGASSLTMTAGGSIELKGIDIAIDGSGSVNIHGASVTSAADADHNINGTTVNSNATAMNTVRGGMVMLNP
jgi:type VI secretion system secreted protein VgrG